MQTSVEYLIYDTKNEKGTFVYSIMQAANHITTGNEIIISPPDADGMQGYGTVELVFDTLDELIGDIMRYRLHTMRLELEYNEGCIRGEIVKEHMNLQNVLRFILNEISGGTQYTDFGFIGMTEGVEEKSFYTTTFRNTAYHIGGWLTIIIENQRTTKE